MSVLRPSTDMHVCLYRSTLGRLMDERDMTQSEMSHHDYKDNEYSPREEKNTHSNTVDFLVRQAYVADILSRSVTSSSHV